MWTWLTTFVKHYYKPLKCTYDTTNPIWALNI